MELDLLLTARSDYLHRENDDDIIINTNWIAQELIMCDLLKGARELFYDCYNDQQELDSDFIDWIASLREEFNDTYPSDEFAICSVNTIADKSNTIFELIHYQELDKQQRSWDQYNLIQLLPLRSFVGQEESNPISFLIDWKKGELIFLHKNWWSFAEIDTDINHTRIVLQTNKEN